MASKTKTKSRSKCLIGRTDESEPALNGGPKFFAVAPTPALGRLVAARYRLWQSARGRDAQLYTLAFWDYEVCWLEDGYRSTKFLPAKLTDRIYDADDSRIVVTLDLARPYFDDTAYHAGVDCQTMLVREDEILWTCYPKNGSIEYSTGPITLLTFLGALAEAELPGDPAIQGFLAGSSQPGTGAVFLDYLQEKGVLE